ncbi:MAG: ferritin family protein [Desulfobacterales bacterium]
MFSFREIIDMATQIEKNGERIYQAAMHHTHDNGLKELLQWMADEEAHHASWLGELAGQSDLLVNDESLKEMSDALVRDYLKDQAFSLKDVDFSAIKIPMSSSVFSLNLSRTLSFTICWWRL